MLDAAIRTFLIVARVGSFSKAAELLHMTQPAVSFQMKSLEASLGLRLFERTTSGVSLTAAGRIVMKHCVELEAVYERLERSLGQLGESLPGRITAGIVDSIAHLVFPEILARFREKAPKIQVTTQIDNSGNLISLLRMDMLDVALAASTRLSSDLWQEEYLRPELTLIVAVDHPWSRTRVVTLGELRRAEFIAREPGSGTRRFLERALREHGVSLKSLRIATVLGNTDSVVSAVKHGIGVSVVPRFAVIDGLREGSLVEVKIDGVDLFETLFVMCRKDRLGRPQIRDFLACFRACAPTVRSKLGL